MDVIELSVQGPVTASKILSVKGFDREGLLSGEAQIREPSAVVTVSDGSAVNGCIIGRNNKVKTRVLKQKHGLDGKRSDRKNLKAPVKTKLDSIISKNGLAICNSFSGGNNILGKYGLKSDTHAVTRHVDELSLNELLDGSYKCPILSQDKGRKGANTNENIVYTVRKACSVLQLKKAPVPSQNDDPDSGSKKTETCLLDITSCSASRMDMDKEDNIMGEKTSSCKIEDSRSKPEAPESLDSKLLHQPTDILERLALLPGKDLDSLLLDTAKAAVSSRTSPDLRVGKSTPHRYRLPPFSWSHSFTGSCKANMDASKVNRSSTCQGRWVRIGNTACTQGVDTGCFLDLDSFACDRNLISLKQLNLGFSKKETTSASVSFPWTEQSLLSTSNSILNLGLPHKSDNYLNAQLKFGLKMDIVLDGTKAEGNLCFGENHAVPMRPLPSNLLFQEDEDNMSKRRKNAGSTEDGGCYSLYKSSVSECTNLQSHLKEHGTSKQDAHSPRLLAAAQILHEISRLSSRQNRSSEKMRWPKKLSQKAMKARKSRSPLRKEVIPVTQNPVNGPTDDDVMNRDRRIVFSKKPRFLMTNNQIKDVSQTSNIGRGPMKFSIPTTTTTSSRSSRLSSNKLEKGLVPHSNKMNSDNFKLLGMMPPSSPLVLDKTCNNNQEKVRKPLFIDWSRGRSKKE